MRILLAIPFLIVVVAFALTNRQLVSVGLWPTDIVVQVPLSIAVLVSSGVFFMMGAVFAWGGSAGHKARARRAERAARQLEAQVQTLRTSRSTALMLPPG